MKKYLSAIILVVMVGPLSAKKVKFAVDMTGQTVSVNGVHVTGDFQVLAGLGADWSPATATLAKEGLTNIYSIIVNIPAFRKYEFRFVNGDQSYEAEFVPEKSRVGYDFVDNRWLYVDSLRNDTTFPGAILFGGNAPAGKSLIRFKVDMRVAGQISPNGVHVGTNYQPGGFDPTKMRLYSFKNDGIYEIIDYVSNNSYSFIFYNGNAVQSAETIPASCSVFGNRGVTVNGDTALNMYCFSSCTACIGVGIEENTGSFASIKIFPNPAKDVIKIEATELDSQYYIVDCFGKETQVIAGMNGSIAAIDLQIFTKGIYVIRIVSKSGREQRSRFLID